MDPGALPHLAPLHQPFKEPAGLPPLASLQIPKSDLRARLWFVIRHNQSSCHNRRGMSGSKRSYAPGSPGRTSKLRYRRWTASASSSQIACCDSFRSMLAYPTKK